VHAARAGGRAEIVALRDADAWFDGVAFTFAESA
jgi:hypothetical protein